MNRSANDSSSISTLNLASVLLANSARRNKQHLKPHKPIRIKKKHHKKVSDRDRVVDKIIEKIIASQLPENVEPKKNVAKKQASSDFSLSVLASNIRKLNSKVKVLLQVQAHITDALSWRQPTKTISILFIYTIFCVRPYFLIGLPILCVLVFIMTPGYNSRHPLPDRLSPSQHFIRKQNGYSSADAESDFHEEQEMVKQELINNQKESRELLTKLTDLQNTMTSVVNIVEAIDDFLNNIGTFAQEKRATAIYILLLISLFATVYISSFIDFRFAVMVFGWVGLIAIHPTVNMQINKAKKLYWDLDEPLVLDVVDYFEKLEVIDEKKDEFKLVEVFEIQRQGLTSREWIPCVFSQEIYDINSITHKAKQRPSGTRFLHDVKAPQGWKFKKQEKWEIDQRPYEWILMHGIQNVQIADEYWAYDYYTEADVERQQKARMRQKQLFSNMIDGDEYLDLDQLETTDYSDELAMLCDGDEYLANNEIKPGKGEWRRRRLIRKCFKK